MFKWILLLILVERWPICLRQVSALKECLHVVRTRYDEPECEIPTVPRTYCHGTSCLPSHEKGLDHGRRRTQDDFQDTCAFIAHSFLVEFEIFDVVLFPVDTCQQELREGELTYESALQVLPNNEELVVLRVPGTMLLDALNHGFRKAPKGGEPRLAGARFELTSTDGLSNIETLSNGCRWKPIDTEGIYYVLTVESLALGSFGYQLLNGGTSVDTSPNASWLNRKLTDMFYKHANYVCWLTDPFRKPHQAKTIKKFEGISTVVSIPVNPGLRQSNNTTFTGII